MHQPGLPSDLDTPPRMWARAATLAVLAGAGLSFDEMTLSDQGVYSWWGGGSVWWRLTLAPGGEAVLVGQDSDASHTHPIRPGSGPLDLLAGMPDRLIYPGLREDLDDFVVCFAYWFADGAWTRIDYPAGLIDDGLAGATSTINDDLKTAWHALEMNNVHFDPAAEAAIADFLRLAHSRAVDDAAVTTLVSAVAVAATDPEDEDEDDRSEPDVATALEVAAAAGLTPALDPPLLGDSLRTFRLIPDR